MGFYRTEQGCPLNWVMGLEQWLEKEDLAWLWQRLFLPLTSPSPSHGFIIHCLLWPLSAVTHKPNGIQAKSSPSLEVCPSKSVPWASPKPVLNLRGGGKGSKQGLTVLSFCHLFFWLPQTVGPTTCHILTSLWPWYSLNLQIWLTVATQKLTDIETSRLHSSWQNFKAVMLGTKMFYFGHQRLNLVAVFIHLCLPTIKILIFWDRLMPWIERGGCHIKEMWGRKAY